MDEALRAAVRAAVGADAAYYVGGCVRDAELERAIVDIDVACTAPEAAARAFRAQAGEAVFELSARHGAWRVLHGSGITVDFVAMRGAIDDDLRQRDFTVNALGRDVHDGALVDPTGGFDDLRRRLLRAVSERIFDDDPLRLLRAARLEQELPLVLEAATEALVRRHAADVVAPAGERVLAELARLGPAGFRRLDELGLLAPLGGTTERLDHLGSDPDARLLLIAALGERLLDLPVPRELARMTRTLLRAQRPEAYDARSIHRFRQATEPWALEALRYLGEQERIPQVLAARAAEPAEPLLRGDELGVPPGPEVGRLLQRIAEERAAGTIATRDEALELVARERR